MGLDKITYCTSVCWWGEGFKDCALMHCNEMKS